MSESNSHSDSQISTNHQDLTRYEKCPECEGSGGWHGEAEFCDLCFGNGYRPDGTLQQIADAYAEHKKANGWEAGPAADRFFNLLDGLVNDE